ncbi:hypothetical protein SRABI134_03646 [Peribacillus sp. Bi134]|nr:hypothetical protein SRABI134_03646 [Peribacillus sp. Bi134]
MMTWLQNKLLNSIFLEEREVLHDFPLFDLIYEGVSGKARYIRKEKNGEKL